MENPLEARETPGASVRQIGESSWRLEIPPGPASQYRLAQLDDYAHLSRGSLPWSPPLTLRLQARASQPLPPGTWGFGLWNDPFSLSLGLGGSTRRFPALPNTAWFFFASPPNYLSLDDSLPAQGGLAATFRSQSLSPAVLPLAAPLMAMFAIPGLNRRFRGLARNWIRQSAAALTGFRPDSPNLGPTPWQEYTLRWFWDEVQFRVGDRPVLTTTRSPHPSLGMVIWIDNQYAALPPDGRLRFGTLKNPEPSWIEVREISLS